MHFPTLALSLSFTFIHLELLLQSCFIAGSIRSLVGRLGVYIRHPLGLCIAARRPGLTLAHQACVST